jgi:3-methylcrotonyl-CoA carboxylase alpha subunit
VNVAWDADGVQLLANEADEDFSAYSEHPALAPGTLHAIADGMQLTLSKPVYDTAAVEDQGDGSTIRAPINGRVAKIFAKAGDVVEKGARIAVVEAMKMEHLLSATAAGTVGKIAVSEGAQVTQGTLIASITVA